MLPAGEVLHRTPLERLREHTALCSPIPLLLLTMRADRRRRAPAAKIRT
ncbi:MAG: hypothetical protein ACM3SS_03415 [Rhodospirillaceae bacterium]